jgi:hypothetical protein
MSDGSSVMRYAEPRRDVTSLPVIDVSPRWGCGSRRLWYPRLTPWATDLSPLRGSLAALKTLRLITD